METPTQMKRKNETCKQLPKKNESKNNNGEKRKEVPSLNVWLSRQEYILGSNLVGTIRISASSQIKTSIVYVVGRCGIDSRWHRTAMVIQRISRDNLYLNFVKALEDKRVTSPKNNETTLTTSFWSSNIVDLKQLKERTSGNYRDYRPRSLELPPDNPELYFVERNTTTQNANTFWPGLDNLFSGDDHLIVTFRANLPINLPPTSSFTCCRYSYAVVVRAETNDGVVLCRSVPFHVVSTPITNRIAPQTNSTVLKQGICYAMAHSSGFPCHLTADDFERPLGQTTIASTASIMTQLSLHQQRDLKTMRISDPQGQPCCILRVIGASCMVPGGTLLLQFDFSNSTGNVAVPCHQVSACLEGHEWAIHRSSSMAKPIRRKTRTLLLDANHEVLDAGCTECVTLSLSLPLDCPVTISNDLVQLSIKCRADLTIEQEMNKSKKAFTNLRLDLPVIVVNTTRIEEENEEEFKDTSFELDAEQKQLFPDTNNATEEDVTHPSNFPIEDIHKELRTLSIILFEHCKQIVQC
mmetsp:Transcript_19510/g.29350  ORF Transcript_19510/g.29350 Transcript_19510/m.29350 type:complete len:524 (+) Transcript_19510:58-1629(+)